MVSVLESVEVWYYISEHQFASCVKHRQFRPQRIEIMHPSIQISRYAQIGVCNTAAYLLIVWLMTWLAEFNQMYANITAYIIVTFFSFWMNARWSFQRKPGVRNYARFQLVAVLGLIASATLGHLGDYFGWHFLVTVFLVGLVIPVMSFLLHRSYTFSK